MLFCSLCSHLSAREIIGKVVDGDERAIEGAAIVAIVLPDSLYQCSAMSNKDGLFKLDIGDETSILLRAQAIGYDTGEIRVGNSQWDVTIRLVQSSSYQLKEVTVVAPKITVSPGKFTFYPGDVVKDVANAFEVLRFVPMLYIDNSKDELELLGRRNPKILINGKEPIMPDHGIIKMLKASDAPRIKRVELWTQPGIAYQNDGMIINLILAPRIGQMGSADLTLTYIDYLSAKVQGWYGAEREKWQFSADVALQSNKNKSHFTQLFSRNIPWFDTEDADNETYETHRYTKNFDNEGIDKRKSINASIGASTDLGHNNTFGFSFSSYFDNDRNDQFNETSYPEEKITESSTKKTTSPFRPTWVIGRANYYHQFDTLYSKIKASIVYQGAFAHQDQSYLPVEVMRGSQDINEINSIQLRGDYKKHFSKKFSLDLGLDIYFDNIRRKLRRSSDGSLKGELTLQDNLRQQQFYTDLYAAVDYEFSHVFSLSAGTRGRWYRRTLEQYIGMLNFTHSDFYLLPLIRSSLSFGRNHLVTLDYNKMVEQPMYYETNPIVYWTSPTYYSCGNPDIKAVNINEIRLQYLLFRKISIGSTVELRNNISDWVTLPGDNGTTYYTPIAIGNSTTTNINIGYYDNFFSHRLSINSSASLNLYHYNNNQVSSTMADAIMNTHQWNGRISLTWYLGRDRSWTISPTGTYISDYRKPFFTRKGYGDFSIAMYKNFKFGGRIMLQMSNLLNHKYQGWYSCEDFSMSHHGETRTRSFLIKFEMTFGKPFRMRSNESTAGHAVN